MSLIKLRHSFTLTILVVFGLLGMKQAIAVLPFEASEAELSRLPILCQVKLGYSLKSTQANIKLYAGKVGPDWQHIHHYCFALKFSNRYKNAYGNKGDQKFYFQSAMGEFKYIFDHSSPSFWMRPEMHVQKGKLFAAARSNAEAVKEFEHALQIKPDYIQAYVALSDLYKNTSQKSKSITVLEQGLEIAPHSKSLQRRYNRLTGKVFTPPPLTAEQTTQTDSPPTPVEQAAAASVVNSTTTPAVSASPPVVAPVKIGTPSNPYCRFCPPE
ncbi:hypothetical protein [Candidatus Nitrotoga sp. M5]|uniref:hypothetical protein n=1 Tax=Candidatus Nitrotoga sp. M5 TaxID=2890409 RepID=UPI001EF308E5|nr:hypothetical protein [Candidatus Nitrotoga sp. M5]CAH1386242.1 Tetratricopeptide repeat-containing protein [Candidatus Nitrotoga sp. M5]